jgi:hypothetical protein
MITVYTQTPTLIPPGVFPPQVPPPVPPPTLPPTPPPAPPQKGFPRSWIAVIAVVAALLVGGGVGLGLFLNGRSTPTPTPTHSSQPATGPSSTAPAALPLSPARIVRALVGTKAADGTTVTAVTVIGTPVYANGVETAELNESFSDGSTYRMRMTYTVATHRIQTHTEYKISSASSPPAAALPLSPARIVRELVGTKAADGTTVTAVTVIGTPVYANGVETAELNESFSDGTTYRMRMVYTVATHRIQTHTEYQIK